MKTLETQIDIDATAEKVFDVLCDVARYERWNPFICKASGRVAEGAVLDILIRPPGSTAMPYAVRVVELEAPRRFVWLGRMKSRFILEGEHIFEVQALGERRVRLIHREHFRGALVPFVWRSLLSTRFRQGFEALNRCLKAEVEGATVGTAP